MSDDNDIVDVKSCILRVSQIDCTLADARRFHLILSINASSIQRTCMSRFWQMVAERFCSTERSYLLEGWIGP